MSTVLLCHHIFLTIGHCLCCCTQVAHWPCKKSALGCPAARSLLSCKPRQIAAESGPTCLLSSQPHCYSPYSMQPVISMEASHPPHSTRTQPKLLQNCTGHPHADKVMLPMCTPLCTIPLCKTTAGSRLPAVGSFKSSGSIAFRAARHTRSW